MSDHSEGADRRSEVAFGAVSQLILAVRHNMTSALPQLKTQLEETISQIDVEADIIVPMMSQHIGHLDHHEVTQEGVDPYKIVCWLGCEILSKVSCHRERPEKKICPFRAVGEALIDTLVGLLAEDSRGRIILSEHTRRFLLQMLIAEKLEHGKHGIWQNGLYAAFHCSVFAFREMERATITESV